MMDWQQEFLEILRNYYSEQRTKNPRYSMRALALQLGTAPGPTSTLIKGTHIWNISPEWALKVIEKMNILRTEKNRFRVLIGEAPQVIVQKVDLRNEDEKSIICHWAYWPVLVHFNMNPQELDIPYIARRLDIPCGEVSQIVEDLIGRTFLLKLEDGKIRRNSERLDMGDDSISLAAKVMQRKSLALAERAINTISTTEKEFQTLTFAGNREALEKAKTEIRNFTDRINFLMDHDKKNDEVYRLSIQLFPVSFGNVK